MRDRRPLIGQAGERHALAHYLRQGFELVEANATCRQGELDLIVTDRTHLVFAEVRTRVEGRGNPLDSFDRRKRAKVRSLAAIWLSSHRIPAGVSSIRIDAVAVTVDEQGRLRSLEVLEGCL